MVGGQIEGMLIFRTNVSEREHRGARSMLGAALPEKICLQLLNWVREASEAQSGHSRQRAQPSPGLSINHLHKGGLVLALSAPHLPPQPLLFVILGLQRGRVCISAGEM